MPLSVTVNNSVLEREQLDNLFTKMIMEAVKIGFAIGPLFFLSALGSSSTALATILPIPIVQPAQSLGRY